MNRPVERHVPIRKEVELSSKKKNEGSHPGHLFIVPGSLVVFGFARNLMTKVGWTSVLRMRATGGLLIGAAVIAGSTVVAPPASMDPGTGGSPEEVSQNDTARGQLDAIAIMRADIQAAQAAGNTYDVFAQSYRPVGDDALLRKLWDEEEAKTQVVQHNNPLSSPRDDDDATSGSTGTVPDPFDANFEKEMQMQEEREKQRQKEQEKQRQAAQKEKAAAAAMQKAAQLESERRTMEEERKRIQRLEEEKAKAAAAAKRKEADDKAESLRKEAAAAEAEERKHHAKEKLREEERLKSESRSPKSPSRSPTASSVDPLNQGFEKRFQDAEKLSQKWKNKYMSAQEQTKKTVTEPFKSMTGSPGSPGSPGSVNSDDPFERNFEQFMATNHPDSASDDEEDEEQARIEAREIFSLADKDGDGKLTHNELKNHLKRDKKLKEQMRISSGGELHWKDLFAQLDTDNDGNVQEEEFFSFYSKAIRPLVQKAKVMTSP